MNLGKRWNIVIPIAYTLFAAGLIWATHATFRVPDVSEHPESTLLSEFLPFQRTDYVQDSTAADGSSTTRYLVNMNARLLDWISNRPVSLLIVDGRSDVRDLEIFRELYIEKVLDKYRKGMKDVRFDSTTHILVETDMLIRCLYLASLPDNSLHYAAAAGDASPQNCTSSRSLALLRAISAGDMTEFYEQRANTSLISQERIDESKLKLQQAVNIDPDYYYGRVAVANLNVMEVKQAYQHKPYYESPEDAQRRSAVVDSSLAMLRSSFRRQLEICFPEIEVASPESLVSKGNSLFLDESHSFSLPTSQFDNNAAFCTAYAVYLNNYLDYINWELLPAVRGLVRSQDIGHSLEIGVGVIHMEFVVQHLLPSLRHVLLRIDGMEADRSLGHRARVTIAEFCAIYADLLVLHNLPAPTGSLSLQSAVAALENDLFWKGDAQASANECAVLVNYLEHSPFLGDAPILDLLGELKRCAK